MKGKALTQFVLSAALLTAQPAVAQAPCEDATILDPAPDTCLADIETDRPHKTDTARPIAAGHTQAEIAAFELALGRGDPEVALWDTQVKVGLSERVEMGLFYTAYEGAPGTASHGQTVASRLKILLVEPHELVLFTFVPYVELSLGGQVEVTSGQLFLAYDASTRTSLEINIGPEWSFASDDLSVVSTGAITYDLGHGLAAFGEFYSDTGVASQRREKRFDTGLLLTVTRDVQIDAGVYFGLEGPVAPQTVFLGTSLRR